MGRLLYRIYQHRQMLEKSDHLFVSTSLYDHKIITFEEMDFLLNDVPDLKVKPGDTPKAQFILYKLCQKSETECEEAVQEVWQQMLQDA